MLNRKQIESGLAVAVIVFITVGFSFEPHSYIDRLLQLRGTPYLTLDCANYICAARQHSHCGSADIFTGCHGSMVMVAEVKTLTEATSIPALQAGDVADFHGIHVAAYIGGGKWMDSNPDHNGVGDMNMHPSPSDLWYTGPVRIMRWK